MATHNIQTNYSLIASNSNNSIKKVANRDWVYFTECNGRKVAGLISLIFAAALLTIAGILASGILGGGKMAFIAGGLAIASMGGLGLAAYLLTQGSSPIGPKNTTLR